MVSRHAAMTRTESDTYPSGAHKIELQWWHDRIAVAAVDGKTTSRSDSFGRPKLLGRLTARFLCNHNALRKALGFAICTAHTWPCLLRYLCQRNVSLSNIDEGSEPLARWHRRSRENNGVILPPPSESDMVPVYDKNERLDKRVLLSMSRLCTC